MNFFFSNENTLSTSALLTGSTRHAFARLHKFGKRFEVPNATFKSDIFVFDQKIATFRSKQGSSFFQQAESPGTPQKL